MLYKRLPALLPVLVILAAPFSAQVPAGSGLPPLAGDEFLADVRFLADDLLEGRGVGTRGDLLARLYIETRMRSLGLVPVGGPSFQHEVPLVAVKGSVEVPLTVRGTSESRTFRAPEDFVAFPGGPTERSDWKGAGIVFVGYGISAPEESWDDFKGADVAGRVLLVMNNDPAGDPALFGGDRRLYYGRWSYKYEEAARRGAIGAIVIHTEPSAGYPFQVIQSDHGHERCELPGSRAPRLAIQAWCSDDAARAIAGLGGQDLDALRARAERRDFKPVDLGVTADLLMKNEVRRFSSANVVGALPGSDPALRDECVILTAHFDHLGIGPDKGGDTIYNGALDNASGVAMVLGLARSFATAAERPRRTLLFAAVTGEESGLLGSRHLAENPPVPIRRIVANLNIDGANIWGPTSDITVIGLGKTSIDAHIEAAAKTLSRTVKPDQMPDKGFFYRSDQFSFARVGVPAVFFDNGLDFIGKPADFGRTAVDAWTKTHYHQPSDELTPAWDISGILDDLELIRRATRLLADADAPPSWAPDDEFEKLRPGR